MREIRKEALPGCLQVDGLLPYTGVGSGFIRVQELDDKIEVLNDEKRKEVIVTFRRESNQGSVRVTEQSNGVTKKSNQEQQEVTKKSNQENKLPGKIKDIVNFCTVPRTAQEIMEHIGITNQSKNRKRYITALVEQGLLKLTIPDNPKDRNQKYVKA